MAMTKPLSEQVTYDGTTVKAELDAINAKLADWVSVKDFGAAGEPRPPTVAECAALLTPWVQTFALACGAAVASGVGVLAHVPRWHGLPE